MPDWLTDWLDKFSAPQLALIFCLFFIGITWLGTVLIHPVMRRLLHRDEPSNATVSSPSKTAKNNPASLVANPANVKEEDFLSRLRAALGMSADLLSQIRGAVSGLRSS
jgi:hypothetical protein